MKTDLCKAQYKFVVNSFTRVYLVRVCFFSPHVLYKRIRPVAKYNKACQNDYIFFEEWGLHLK